MTTKTDNHAEERAAAQYSCIVEMLAAVEVDYDRLAELREEREELTEAVTEAADAHKEAQDSRAGDIDTWHELEDARKALTEWTEENAEELAELEEAAGDCDDEEDARQRISEGPLSVEVRSDWASLGEELTAGEFRILLCTGGPAVRIRGELDRGEPCRAWLEFQDWGTPWTQYFGASSETMCQYASHFFSGE